MFRSGMEDSWVVIKEARPVASLGRAMRNQMEAKREEFFRKGSLGLWWDSTVPEDEKQLLWFLHSFSLKSSDKRKVLAEIDRYIELYKNIEYIPFCSFNEIEELDANLREYLCRAEKQMKRTSSKTIYKISKDLLLSKLGKNIEIIKDELGVLEFKKLRENFKKIVADESEKFTKQFKMEIEQLLEENSKDVEDTERMRASYQNQLQELELSVRHMEAVMHKSMALAGNVNKLEKYGAEKELGNESVAKENFEAKRVAKQKSEDEYAVGMVKFQAKSDAEEIIEAKYVVEEPMEAKSFVNESMKSMSLVEKTIENKFVVEEAMEDKYVVEEAMEDKSVVEEAMEDKSVVEEAMEDKYVVEEAMEDKSVVEGAMEDKSVVEEITEEKSIVKEARREMYC